MSQRRREVLIGIVVLAVCAAYVVWQRAENEQPANAGTTDTPDPSISTPTVDLLLLATEDDIPYLTELLAFDNLPVELSNWVGRDPRMFSRGASSERIARLQELADEFEPFATIRTGTTHIALRLNVARANYAMALITAELTANDNTGDWGLTALNELEELHQIDPEDDEATLLLALVNRLLGQVETGQDHHDRAVAHQLLASDLIGGLLEGHQQDPGLQLEWGLQQTYLAEAELKFDKAQHAYQTFQVAIVCFEECVSLSPDPPVDDPVAEALWRSQDASRRYFEAYNAHAMAKLLTRANQSLTAREYWGRSLDLFEGLAEAFPESMKFRQRYAQSVSNEGTQLSGSDRSEALSVYLQAVDLYRPLVAEAPFDATNQYGLAMATGNVAMMSAIEDEFDAALEYAYESLNAWDKYLLLRPDDNPDFRHMVVWKTAELLAAQATERLSTEPPAALEVAKYQQEMVGQNWEQNAMLRQSTTLHALELALAKAACDHVESLNGAVDTTTAGEWLPILDTLTTRLYERQPMDDAVQAIRERVQMLTVTRAD